MKLLFLVAMTVFAQQSSLEAVYRMMQAGDWKNADRELTARLAADPRNAAALTARAYLFAQLGDHQQAIAFARQALAHAPKDEHARNLLALSLMSTGQRDAGMQELQSVLRANPNNAAALRNLGLAYLQAGFPEKSVPLLEKRLQLEPRDQFVRIDLIGTYYQLANPSRAAALMAAVPNDPDLLEKLCRTLNERDQYGESIKRLESFSRHAQLDPALRLVLAEAYTGAGTPARAAELLASIPASQRNAGYALTLAWTSSVRDDLPAAIQTLQQAIHAEPEDARLYHALSMLLLRAICSIPGIPWPG